MRVRVCVCVPILKAMESKSLLHHCAHRTDLHGATRDAGAKGSNLGNGPKEQDRKDIQGL